MRQRDVELAGFFGSGPFVTRCFRHQTRSIGCKRHLLPVGVTVDLHNIFENLSSCAGLRRCGTIEWE